MTTHLPLRGVRFHLSGSIPDDATDKQSCEIRSFVEHFVAEVLREGGTVIHGSHPTLIEPLRAAAASFVEDGGPRDSVILVRAQKYADTDDQKKEIDIQREFAVVQIIPSKPGKPIESLVPMREWMAERSDVVVAIGGKWWDKNKGRVGVPVELEESLKRGKPGFLLAGFGGALAGYLKDERDVLSRLRNGMNRKQNRAMATSVNGRDVAHNIVSQAKLLPLVRRSVASGRLFRILVLDGGGIRGTFTAAVLAQWAQMLDSGGEKSLIGHFDLVAGTSTGAILAIGLGLGLTPLEILSFYKNMGPEIFSNQRWIGSKYDSGTLKVALLDALGVDGEGRPRLLKESCCRLVIPTVRADHGKADVIVTPHSLDCTAFDEWSAVDAALASAAAPSYFDEANVEGPIATESFLDGGIWANNPVLAAIAEAVGPLKRPIDRIDVLSVAELSQVSRCSSGEV